jgi:hypothetical protein
MPLDLLTSKSFYNDAPYRHLQMLVVNQDIREWYSKFILRTKETKSYGEILEQKQRSLTFAQCKVASDFSRHHLTHLDPVIFNDDNLPIELFMDFDEWIRPLANEIKKEKLANELSEDQERVGVSAITEYTHRDGTREPLEVTVQHFEPERAKFWVSNKAKGLGTLRSRLFIRTKGDKASHLEAVRQDVLGRKAEALHALRLHRLITEEMTKRYTYIRLSNSTLEKVLNRIFVDLHKYNPDSVRKIIL